MSINVTEKLASGKTLSDDEVQWAREHAIALPEEYGDPVVSESAETVRPSEPIFQGGPAFAPASQAAGPGLFLTVDQLDSLDKATLSSLADAAGYEVSGRASKASIVETLAGGSPSGEEEDEDEEQG